MRGLECTSDTVQAIEYQALSILTLIAEYRWVVDAYVVEFFVKDHWARLPVGWQEILSKLSFPQLASELMDLAPSEARKNSKSVWPLSLLAFKSAAKALCLDRHNVLPLHSSDDHQQDVDKYFNLHVNNKKRQEIWPLAQLINSASKSNNCERVIDVGGGRGHLTRLLSYGYGLKVTSVEAAGCHIVGATKVDRKVKMLLDKKMKERKDALSEPSHVICRIQPDITPDSFLKVISNRLNHEVTSDSETNNLEMYQTEESDCVKQQTTCNTFKKVTSVGPSERHTYDPNQDIMQWDLSMTSQDVSRKDNGFQRDIFNNPQNQLDSNSGSHHTFFTTSAGSIERTSKGGILKSSNKTNSENLSKPNLTKFLKSDGFHSSDQQYRLEPQNVKEDDEKDYFALIGLHTCGDLVPTMLRVFTRCPSAKVLASVGCCYMKMDCVQQSDLTKQNDSKENLLKAEKKGHTEHKRADTDKASNFGDKFEDVHSMHNIAELCSVSHTAGTETVQDGFPMCRFLRKAGMGVLGFEALELACHFYDSYAQRLKADDPTLKLQAYRAVLEILIQRQKPELVQKHSGIRQIKKATAKVKKHPNMSFEQYAQIALSNLGLIFDPEEASDLESKLLGNWKNLITFHSLRLCLAPVVESLILLDRMMYLYDQGISSKLIPVFDPIISPRNFVLLASK